MTTQNITATLLVDQSPAEVYNAINNVRGWWSATLQGASQKLGDEFIYRYKDMHYSKQKLVEMVENQKVVWEVLDSQLTFLDKKDEWTGTTISFDISKKGDKTQLVFTHYGLTPQCECYDACTNGWNHYLQGSLLQLITTGKGEPAKEIAN